MLRALVADADGELLLERQVNDFRAVIFDHTIAPRDAAVVRYALSVPRDVSASLQVRARLRHRSRNLRLESKACAASQSPLGRAFAQASVERKRPPLRACTGQPITNVAETSIWVGQPHTTASAAGQPASDPPATWRRLYEHGLAWTHAVQERLEQARPSLIKALDLVTASPTATNRDKAMVLTALGQLAGRQGRTQEALTWLDRANALLPGHPAIASIRGAALTRVWRWKEAQGPLADAADLAPGNARAWSDLAIARGSLGASRTALDAAIAGLALAPRDGALLRVQALSLRALGAPLADRALDAYDVFRKPDQAMDIRFACAARSAMCARERDPVHVLELRATTALRK